MCLLRVIGSCIFVAAIVCLAIGNYREFKCLFCECCTERWITNNIKALNTNLDNRVYGQHLVKQIIPLHIYGHLTNPNPTKPLVLSFNGPTGTGKSYVSRIIAEALYRNGMGSENVLKIDTASIMFLHKHKNELTEMISTHVQKCKQSLVIIDQIDQMPMELIDTIKPYLDNKGQFDGVDYRRAIFIFLSNAGSSAITEYLIQQLNDGFKREDIEMEELENLIASSVVKTKSGGGLTYIDLVGRHLVSVFVPFFPLERTHIHKCIRETLVSMQHYKSQEEIPYEIVEEVNEHFIYYPIDFELFSSSGCKRVFDKVNFVMYS